MIIFLSSCLSYQDNPDHRLVLEKENIKEITFQCFQSETILLNHEEIDFLIKKINTAKPAGPRKAIITSNLTIYLIDNDSIKIRIDSDYFKWKNSGDWSYQLDIDKDYFQKKCSELLQNN